MGKGRLQKFFAVEVQNAVAAFGYGPVGANPIVKKARRESVISYTIPLCARIGDGWATNMRCPGPSSLSTPLSLLIPAYAP